MTATRSRLTWELAAAAAAGAAVAFQFHWQISTAHTMLITESGDWWPVVLPLTLLLHSGALVGELLGGDLAGRLRLEQTVKDAVMCGAGMLMNAAVFALTWFLLRTGTGGHRWRRVVAMAGWVVWIALGYALAVLAVGRRD